MKKIGIIFICLISFFSLVNFERVKADNETERIRYGHYVFSVAHQGFDIQYNTIIIDGMEYAVFGGQADGHHYGGVSVAVINVTKDKLEVELLKKQLNKK